MDENTSTSYPAWQQTIREAQQAMLEQEYQEEMARLEMMAESDRDAGRNLGLALKHFGIEVKPLTSRVVIDGIEFELQTFYYTQLGFIEFGLSVHYLLPDAIEDWTVDGRYDHWGHVAVAQREEESWMEPRAELARVIDQVTEGAKKLVALYETEQRQGPPAVTAPEREDPAKQFVQWIRNIIQAELRGDIPY